MESIPIQEIASRITSTGWDILQILSKTEDMSRTEIENKMRLSTFKGAEQIARLYAAALIDYARGDNDNRFKKFKVTSFGMEALKLKK